MNCKATQCITFPAASYVHDSNETDADIGIRSPDSLVCETNHLAAGPWLLDLT